MKTDFELSVSLYRAQQYRFRNHDRSKDSSTSKLRSHEADYKIWTERWWQLCLLVWSWYNKFKNVQAPKCLRSCLQSPRHMLRQSTRRGVPWSIWCQILVELQGFKGRGTFWRAYYDYCISLKCIFKYMVYTIEISMFKLKKKGCSILNIREKVIDNGNQGFIFRCDGIC